MPVTWTDGICRAIDYIESNITEDLSITDIAGQAFMSAYYFQKGFSMLCGFTVGEYIRQRKLSLAGSELVSTGGKIIDVALKYGYDSPDSFAKAFSRFHGITPTAAIRNGALIKTFARFKIIISLEGGYIMDYKIVEKESFTIVGMSKNFQYASSLAEIPAFWAQHYQTGKNKLVCGIYGVCLDGDTSADEFEYLIADDYAPGGEVPAGAVTRVIPKYTWAVFPCKGAMPNAIQDTNRKIFSEWLPGSNDYEIAAGCNVEWYSDPADYPGGLQNENYYSEIWIPVRKK